MMLTAPFLDAVASVPVRGLYGLTHRPSRVLTDILQSTTNWSETINITRLIR